ncbi:hypothetical protein [Sphingobium sp. EP60837]|jgi:hypothetical protein|uniref:hypothetical protein n=1 Tax=Sphingobium sp. EP60837 TaxID=1855519 RepID=UPI0007DD2235|nr:hypothetical protein [Sphingobium sp. EP60837]ANI78491.1 hypothetical protein EP837_02085 [Sphingobium sp. EP60837]
MPIITIRLDEELHRRVKGRAANAHLSISDFLRPLLEDVAFPGGRYAYTGQDELLGIAIQTYALIVEIASVQPSPVLVERAIANAGTLMRERGLIDPAAETLAGVRSALFGNREEDR